MLSQLLLAADVTMESSKTATYIVCENCLLEPFVCQRVSDVRTRRVGPLVSTLSSPEIFGSALAGKVHLSVAVYATGASLFRLEKIFRAVQLKMIH